MGAHDRKEGLRYKAEITLKETKHRGRCTQTKGGHGDMLKEVVTDLYVVERRRVQFLSAIRAHTQQRERERLIHSPCLAALLPEGSGKALCIEPTTPYLLLGPEHNQH